MRYKVILMDADETLFDFQAGNRIAVSQLMDEVGYVHPDRYAQYEAINLQCWAALEKGLMTQNQLKTARFVRFFDRYRIEGDPKAAGERFVALLGEQAQLLPHAEEAVRQIAAALPVIILTNGITAVQKNRLARSPLKNVVSGMVISEEVGVSKPRPEIFYEALERLGVRPRDALMIGDGVNSDIRGANNAGVDACWLNPAGKPLPEGVHAEYIVSDLRACVEIALREN
ncbi:MAG: YjjG family noncanonical pyrimidine nucleotidase [Clostridia bacterium]|nr:YjjG family noncanonical pyrimidine nucleotidase [Clostridia bacterium]